MEDMGKADQLMTRLKYLEDALERIARFAEAYELVTSKKSYENETVGSALCITLGHYARKVIDGQNKAKINYK